MSRSCVFGKYLCAYFPLGLPFETQKSAETEPSRHFFFVELIGQQYIELLV